MSSLGCFRDVVLKLFSSSLLLLGFSSSAFRYLHHCLTNTDYKKLVALQDESQIVNWTNLDDHSSNFFSLILNQLLYEWEYLVTNQLLVVRVSRNNGLENRTCSLDVRLFQRSRTNVDRLFLLR